MPEAHFCEVVRAWQWRRGRASVWRQALVCAPAPASATPSLCRATCLLHARVSVASLIFVVYRVLFVVYRGQVIRHHAADARRAVRGGGGGGSQVCGAGRLVRGGCAGVSQAYEIMMIGRKVVILQEDLSSLTDTNASGGSSCRGASMPPDAAFSTSHLAFSSATGRESSGAYILS